MNTARLARGEALSLKSSEYVEAARSVGVTTWRIKFRHLLLNSIHIILPSFAILVAQNLLAEATLSWMGIQEHQPSLGNMMMREVNPLRTRIWTIPIFLPRDYSDPLNSLRELVGEWPS